MKHLTARELLDVWERGLNQPLLQRTLIILLAACPENESGCYRRIEHWST